MCSSAVRYYWYLWHFGVGRLAVPLLTISVCYSFFFSVAVADSNPRGTPPLSDKMDGQGARRLWAFQPPRKAALPPVNDKTWVGNSMDRFILNRLEQNSLHPSAPATPRELIRRVYFDMLGLPPSPLDIDAFLADDSSDAYERLVDRLLENHHYGEKWAQHWLDVIRFSESEGFEYDRHLPGAWRFRDFVIQSLNEDKPFDRFLREQIAGDEMQPVTNDRLIAAGFHRFGPVRRNAGNPEVAFSRNEVLTERTDIIGTAFLGLTIGCARCHDHKFDPITQEDYYSLQAFLAATYEHNEIIASPQEKDRWLSESKPIQQRIEEVEKKVNSAQGVERRRLRRALQKLKSQLPPAPTTATTIKNDEATRTTIHVLKRGSWEQQGDRVRMRFPRVLASQNTPELPADTSHPRTKLADWLASPENPLTARVIVNRLWLYHFSNGLVNTPNDFGQNGERPSHPDLLDFLALHLIENGWRLKSLHRMILLSNTYRQSSRTPPSQHALATDPENRLLWRFNRRRLMAEELRDAMLAVSGRLNTKMFGESIVLPVDQELMDLLYKPDQWQVTKDRREHDRRSVYLIAKRNLRLPFMESFDQPTLQNSCARRESSTHAPQALELLNGSISNELADAFAKRLVREVGADPARTVERAWLLATGGPPNDGQAKLAQEFLNEQPLREFALAVFNLNEFLYVH